MTTNSPNASARDYGRQQRETNWPEKSNYIPMTKQLAPWPSAVRFGTLVSAVFCVQYNALRGVVKRNVYVAFYERYSRLRGALRPSSKKVAGLLLL